MWDIRYQASTICYRNKQQSKSPTNQRRTCRRRTNHSLTPQPTKGQNQFYCKARSGENNKLLTFVLVVSTLFILSCIYLFDKTPIILDLNCRFILLEFFCLSLHNSILKPKTALVFYHDQNHIT